MKKVNLLTLLGVILMMFSCTDNIKLASGISLSPIFADNMVLQQKQPVKIWGKALPGGTVKVAINGQEKKSVAGSDSTWSVSLDPMDAGGPYEFKIIGKDTLTYKNVLVGEVWICSGQSNMEMPLNLWGDNNYAQEIKAADYPEIRLLTVKKTTALVPDDELILTEEWESCSPENAGEFSAVGFFFAKELHEKLKVPIGIIHSSWGGTPVEAWTPAPALTKINEYTDIIKSYASFEENKDSLRAAYYQDVDKWKKGLDTLYAEKIGAVSWESPKLDNAKWQEMSVPGYWEDAGLKNTNGIVWFRRSFNIAFNPKGKTFVLNIGCVDDQDATYINGKIVGSHQLYNDKRIYRIDGNILHEGTNVIAVMVRDYGGNGGFSGKPEEMYLSGNKDKRISLSGSWKYKVLTNAPNYKIPWAPEQPSSPSRPTVLYNAMINPLTHFGIRGVIWYQGEANTSRAKQYRKLFPAMIASWRKQWGIGDFPFYFVQLANFMERKKEPIPSNWAMLREAQAMVLKLPNTGVATAIDVGEGDNVHFKNKEAVGHRLALNALNMTYGMDIPYSGPVFKEMKIENGKIHVSFTHIEGGLQTSDGKSPKGFAVAGQDGKYYWAEAKIENDMILLWSGSVAKPISVRYAWADNPDCNLYNKAGLPALPFRTDIFDE